MQRKLLIWKTSSTSYQKRYASRVWQIVRSKNDRVFLWRKSLNLFKKLTLTLILICSSFFAIIVILCFWNAMLLNSCNFISAKAKQKYSKLSKILKRSLNFKLQIVEYAWFEKMTNFRITFLMIDSKKLTFNENNQLFTFSIKTSLLNESCIRSWPSCD